jgi:hypothetical protein
MGRDLAGPHRHHQARLPPGISNFGPAPNSTSAGRRYLIQRCQHQQFEMLTWGKELPPPEKPLPDHLTGDLASLIHCYRTDKDSPYQKNRYHVRQNRDSMLRRIDKRYGERSFRTSNGGRCWVAQGLEQDGSIWRPAWLSSASSAPCSASARLIGRSRLRAPLRRHDKMRFTGHQARGKKVTAEYAEMIRKRRHEHFGWPSIALAQAFQFECTLRQKDVIGEWVPLSGAGRVRRTIAAGRQKWLRGIVWQEIDENLILKHVTSKKQKMVRST